MEDVTPPVVVCPLNRTFAVAIGANTVNLTQAALVPTYSDSSNLFVATTLQFTTTGANGSVVLVPGSAAVTSAAIGNAHVVFTAVDAHGNRAECNYIVLVVDLEPPKVTCPDDVVQLAEAGATTHIVVFENATATDNCAEGVQIFYTLPSGTAFVAGAVTQVNVSAFDRAGLEASCMFDVHVIALAATGSGSTLDTTTTTAIASASACIFIILAALFVLYRRAKRSQRKQAHNFEIMMADISGIMLMDSSGPVKPLELRREDIIIVETIGKGHFGEVSKGLIKQGRNEFMVRVFVHLL